MADMRRPDREPPPGAPEIRLKPGMADELLRELAPLLAEDGIDLSGDHPPDLQTLQRALDQAVERRNLAAFTPVGERRELAVTTLRLVVAAIANHDSNRAGALIEQIQPESPDGSEPEVSACIGVALGCLDEWLSGRNSEVPTGLRAQVRLPDGRWVGERAATDILALAGKGRAFSSLGKLIVRQGGEHTLYGSCLALSAALLTWSHLTETPATELAATLIR